MSACLYVCLYVCMQYEIGPDGVVKVIEVNPRVSTKLLGDGYVRFYVCMYACMYFCMYVCSTRLALIAWSKL